MSRGCLALLALLTVAGCDFRAVSRTDDPADGEQAAEAKTGKAWPVRQAGHVSDGLETPLPLEPALEDARQFSDQLARLASTAAQLEGYADFDSAVEVRREILEKLERRYGARSWQAINGRVAMAHSERLAELGFADRARLLEIGEAERWSDSLIEQGKPKEALAEARRACELTRAVWGDDYYLTANRCFDVAQLLHALGEQAEAEEYYTRALKTRCAALGREHPDYVAVLNALAVHYQVNAQYSTAEKMLREAAELDRLIWGERHPAYATQLNNLGMLFHAAGRSQDAIGCLQESAEIRREALGEEHALFAHSLYNLGSIYHALEDHLQAAPRFETAIAIFEEELGSLHHMTLLAKNNLAMVELARKNFGQSEKLLQDVVASVREQSGEDSTTYASALSQLAALYSHQENYVEAEKHLAEAQQILERALPPNHELVLKTLTVRAETLRRANRPEEAAGLEARMRQSATPKSAE